MKFVLALLLIMIIGPFASAQVCDGYTDDTAAIQAKLNLGGYVTLPDGVCRVSELYISVNGTTLDGRGKTSIQRIPGTYKSLIILPKPWGQHQPTDLVKDVAIMNLMVDGNRVGSQPEGQSNFYGIFVLQAENVLIVNNISQDERYGGITVANGYFPNKNVQIFNNNIYRTRWAGIHLGSVRGARVSGNFIDDTPVQQKWSGGTGIDPAAGNGIDVEVEGYDSVVEDFTIEYNTISRMHIPGAGTAGTGIALQPAYGPIRRGLIQHNKIRNHQAGVWLDIGNNVVTGGVEAIDTITIHNNKIFDDNNWTDSFGIGILGASNIRITKNEINKIFGPSGVPWSILLHGGHDFVIANNTLLALRQPHRPYQVRIQDSSAGPTRNVVLRDNLYNRDQFLDVSPNATGIIQSNNSRIQ